MYTYIYIYIHIIYIYIYIYIERERERERASSRIIYQIVTHTCHNRPPSEIDLRLFWADFTDLEGKHLFHRIGWKGRIWQVYWRSREFSEIADPRLAKPWDFKPSLRAAETSALSLHVCLPPLSLSLPLSRETFSRERFRFETFSWNQIPFRNTRFLRIGLSAPAWPLHIIIIVASSKTYIYIYIHTYMHTYIYIYIHTYI